MLGLLLVEEVKRRVLGLDRLVTLGTAILITLSFVGEKGVELHVFSTLKRKVSGLSCNDGPEMRTLFGGSWILESMKFVSRMYQSGGRTPYSPDVDETFSIFLGSQRGDSDLAKDYGSVAGGSSADFNEVVLDGEVNKLGIRDLGGTRPHPRTRSYG